MRFFLKSQGSFNPKIRFLGQKMCSVAWLQTDRHEIDYCGHHFRVSGVFPSTYHQRSAQYMVFSYLFDKVPPCSSVLRITFPGLRFYLTPFENYMEGILIPLSWYTTRLVSRAEFTKKKGDSQAFERYAQTTEAVIPEPMLLEFDT